MKITARIGTLYVLSGFIGSLVSALSTSSKISVGSSGSLFGLLGAMISELIINWTIYGNKVIFSNSKTISDHIISYHLMISSLSVRSSFDSDSYNFCQCDSWIFYQYGWFCDYWRLCFGFSHWIYSSHPSPVWLC